MKITIYQVDMTILGERDDAPVDVVRVLHVVAESADRAVETAERRYASSLESALSTRGPLKFEARPCSGDVLDASGSLIESAPPRVKLTNPGARQVRDEFWAEVDTEIAPVKRIGTDPKSGARLYSYSFGRRWSMQVRGHLKLADGSYSDKFIVATASLGPAEMRALRDMIQRELVECGEDLAREGDS